MPSLFVSHFLDFLHLEKPMFLQSTSKVILNNWGHCIQTSTEQKNCWSWLQSYFKLKAKTPSRNTYLCNGSLCYICLRSTRSNTSWDNHPLQRHSISSVSYLNIYLFLKCSFMHWGSKGLTAGVLIIPWGAWMYLGVMVIRFQTQRCYCSVGFWSCTESMSEMQPWTLSLLPARQFVLCLSVSCFPLLGGFVVN